MKRALPPLLLAACAIAFLIALLALFQLRFSVGDVHPPYSSLRSDPQGTMVFYESLESLSGLSVKRDLTVANRLPAGDGTTYLHLAGNAEQWRKMPEDLVKTIEQFLREGGRLVVALKGDSLFEKKKDSEKEDLKKDEDKEEEESTPPIVLAKRWGFDFQLIALDRKKNPDAKFITVTNTADPNLPAEMDWHSKIALKDLSPEWQVIYSAEDKPVVAERKFGRGSLAIATDSYFFSNEAMLNHRHPGVLARMIGQNPRIFFDEGHLGITENSGIAALARKYRLHGAIVVLLILAGLFIWKNSTSLVPAPPAPDSGREYVIGRDSASGFAALLRRNIKANQLLEACAAEWNKTFAHGKKYSTAKKEAVAAILENERALPAKNRDAVAAYRRISEVLAPAAKGRRTRPPQDNLPPSPAI